MPGEVVSRGVAIKRVLVITVVLVLGLGVIGCAQTLKIA